MVRIKCNVDHNFRRYVEDDLTNRQTYIYTTDFFFTVKLSAYNIPIIHIYIYILFIHIYNVYLFLHLTLLHYIICGKVIVIGAFKKQLIQKSNVSHVKIIALKLKKKITENR